MTDKLDTVMPKLLPLVRMISSNVDGEVLNAMRALLRLLAGAGLDIHALTDRIEHGGEAPLNAGEMQQIYDKAYEKGFADGSDHGRRSAVIAAQPIGTFATSVDDGVNGYSWQQIANHCLMNKHLFYGRKTGETVFAAAVVGILLTFVLINASTPPSTISTATAPATPAAPTTPATPTEWLGGFTFTTCEKTASSPARVYETHVKAGNHPKLIDQGDIVKIDTGDLTVIFYRTMAACEAAERDIQIAADAQKKRLDKYR
jgi:hypothetical protein